MMRRASVVGVLAAIGVSVASANPEEPTLLETAAFLLTGVHAEEMERLSSTTLVSSKTIVPNYFRVISVLKQNERQCILALSDVTGSKPTLENLSTSDRIDTVVDVSRLTGEVSWTRLGEVAMGVRVVGRRKVEWGRASEPFSYSDNLFLNLDSASSVDMRKKAWTYLNDNFCDFYKRPF